MADNMTKNRKQKSVSNTPHQSLYRRYRPQTFAQVVGQTHAVLALRNAVSDNKVNHAYLFSGPRGTGKTSMARIFAKALNCLHPEGGEPDDTCDSCISITAGTSLDVHELDAASNNGVDAMRDLVSRSALGNPGRYKVYIIDEVHMLSTAASNALLKTLEEPPNHVVFVLATTDPQKVLPTILSRTQHLKFKLLSTEQLTEMVEAINLDASLDVSATGLSQAVREGHGSARDTLSALDRIVAVGESDDTVDAVAAIVEALCHSALPELLSSVAVAVSDGRDPLRLATELIDYLRNGFLSLMAPELVSFSGTTAISAADHARRLRAPGVVRAMETIGQACLDMRDSPDPRVTLEVALIKLGQPSLDNSIEAIMSRLDIIEASLKNTAPAPTEPSAPAEQNPDDQTMVQSPAPDLPAVSAPSTVQETPPGPAGAWGELFPGISEPPS